VSGWQVLQGGAVHSLQTLMVVWKQQHHIANPNGAPSTVETEFTPMSVSGVLALQKPPLSFTKAAAPPSVPTPTWFLTRSRPGGENHSQVEIEQNTGKTQHSVIPLRGKNSSYVVQAPGASASVQGTTFSVAVSDNGQSHFAVHSGKVQVSNDRNQVLITAGQATLAQPNQTLEYPRLYFQRCRPDDHRYSNTWKVAGVNFILNEQTSINGTPVVGDDLIVTGRIIANNTFIADNIAVALISQPSASFTGVIQHQGETAWLVSDQNVLVNAASIIAVDLLIGDPVLVTYTVLDDGEWLAQSIASLDEATELIPESAIPSPVPGAKPELVFYPEEQYADICGTLEYTFEGILVNEGQEEK
jgi:mannose-6-phosphate isomerase-like protein (cupin superfamily)